MTYQLSCFTGAAPIPALRDIVAGAFPRRGGCHPLVGGTVWAKETEAPEVTPSRVNDCGGGSHPWTPDLPPVALRCSLGES